MTAPRTKPLPLFGSHPADLQAREELERLKALEEVEREQEAEALIRAAEFGPVPDVDEERCEREWDYMLAHEDLALYSEWGVVR